MILAPWRSSLARALHRNRSQPFSRYLQLATIRLDGKPANRTVVFRGFREDTNQLQFVTDTRSAKIAQLELNPWAEACWYFTQTREQFRFLGALQVITTADTEGILLQLWQKLSPAARQQFTWSHPGKPVEENPPESYPVSESSPELNFAVLLLDPVEVDHLELRGNPQQRQRYWLGENALWLEARINP